MNKVLTVSIAAYNIAKTLREVVDPFLLENVTDRVEVLIVDDGSKDDTAKIALEYQEKYPDTFRLISKENGGWGSTLNTGMRAARGKYFKQLDGDDFFSYENLASFLDYLETCDSDIVHTPFVTFTDSNGGILKILNDFRWQDYSWYPKEKTLLMSDCPYVQPEMHNFAIKSKLLQKNDITITEHCFYTDVEYCLKAFCTAKTISFYERPIYYYRLGVGGQSVGVGGIRKHYRENQKMLLGMLHFFKHELTEHWMYVLVSRRLHAVCDLMYRMYFALDCTKEQKKELIEFDRILRDEYPEFYRGVNDKGVKFLRKTKFNGYWFIAHRRMRNDRKRKINFFEGE